ncbi:MAG TPA: hypothetical protein DCS93_15475 [Microscillaceae bacterium]|nr:hypothetical protein [Microscillaceae bacterium]
MRNQYKVWLCLLLLVGMTSCTDKSELIARSWGLDLSVGVDKSKLSADEKARLEQSTSILEQFAVTLEFKKDGTLVSKSREFSKWTHWKVEGNKLLLIRDKGNIIQKVKIAELTEKRLGLDFNDGKVTYFNAMNKGEIQK